MTRFLDVRIAPVGGNLATSVTISQGTNIANYAGLPLQQLLADIAGRNVLIGVHGFNVNRADGIAHLSNWEGLLQLPSPSVFIGLLWPGDSIWAHGLDYPEEPKVADEAGELIAPFLDEVFVGAASVSFVSHSLGARVVLQTVLNMKRSVRRVTLMAGAIDDDCLSTEFKAAAAQIGEISALASTKDEVLSLLFPLGNFFGGILDKGHPWWRAALGHLGPSAPPPGNFQAPFQIPDDWGFGHGNYLQIDPPPPPPPTIPVSPDFPIPGAPLPAGGAQGWQEEWSAMFCSERFR